MAIGSDVLLSDDFDRADGALGSDWTVITGAFGIETNQAGTSDTTSRALAIFDAALIGSPDYKMAFTVNSQTTVGCLSRGSGATGNVSGYLLGRSGNNIYFGKIDDNTISQLAAPFVGTAMNNLITYETETSGSDVVLRAKDGENLLGAYTDSAPAAKYLTAGYAGLYSNAVRSDIAWDDFTATGTAVSVGLTLDSAPSTMARGETGLDFVVSSAAVTPTTLNSTVKAGTVPLVVTGVTGAGPWTITASAPAILALQHSVTGHIWTVAVAAESVATSEIPLTPTSGWAYADLSVPVNTAGTLGDGYLGAAAVTSDQWVFETTTTPDSIAITLDPQGYWCLASGPTSTNTALVYLIQADGSLETQDTVTFSINRGSRLSSLGSQFSPIIAHRLNGHIEK